jgi:hypothetical protein
MIKTQAMQRKQEMQNLFGDGPFSEEVANCIQNAEQAMVMAQNFEETEPRAAVQQYLRAMNQFRNAFRKLLSDNPDLVDEFVEPSDSESAGDVIGDTFSDEDVQAAKSILLNRYKERYREQIQVMIDLVDELENDLSPNDAVKARNALMHTLERTLRIQERINQGDFDEAVEDFDDTVQELDGEFDGLEDEDCALMLREMNRLEARNQKMMGNAARKAAKGVDTSDEDAALEELNGLKNQLKQGFIGKKGNGNQGSNGSGQGTQGGN